MILRKSTFVHLVPMQQGRVLLIHALRNHRLAIDSEVASIIDFFAQPRDPAELQSRFPQNPATLQGFIATLIEQGILTEQAAERELSDAASQLAAFHGRDPAEMLERWRRSQHQGTEPGWAVASARGIAEFSGQGRRIELLLFGDCELQMEADFLRREMSARGIDLNVAATFPDDVRFASERAHDAILIGALRSRREIASGNPGAYIDEAGWLIQGLREFSAKPILIDNLPEPTVQPLGLAEQGPDAHRNRFRRVNLALSELAGNFSDVHVIDVAAALGQQGARNLLDDGLVSFTHFGSPGWMLQRPASELDAVHGIFPDLGPLAASMDGDPYRRETIVAKLHADSLAVILALDRKKCVIVDLDGTLWPGILAETGAPFSWTPEISGPFSFVGLYFGIHEALRMLIRRGIVLACVSKNDEATVRELWRYPAHYPQDRLLSLDHFVTHRINWEDKVENIRSIAEELGFALNAFLFVDDNPLERERVRRRLSEVAVLGDDLFALRRQLLDDPRLQVPRITDEARQRSELTKAQLDRAKIRQASSSESEFLASLDVQCEIERPGADADFGRIRELFERTTQFNTTGRKFTDAELAALAAAEGVYAMRVRDRFGDHGLVAAAAIEDREIVGFVMSCRVIGLGVEHRLLERILSDLRAKHDVAGGRIIETARNVPVRNLYRDHGFAGGPDGHWQIPLNDGVKNSVTIAAQP